MLGLAPGDVVVHRPRDFPWCRLDGERICKVRAEFRHRDAECGLTAAQVVEEIGLIDEAFYLSWEAGNLHDEVLAFQYRILKVYARWSGEPLDALLLRGAAALTPVQVQGAAHADPFVGRLAVLTQLGQWLAATTAVPRVLAIQGASGSGKSALLARFLDGLGEETRPGGGVRLGEAGAAANLAAGLHLRVSLGHPEADETRRALAQTCPAGAGPWDG